MFRSLNPDKLIVVHCTHGCNRTGFFICAYLIMEMNIDPQSSINLFKTARPPGINKIFFIEELFIRYGSENCDDTCEYEYIGQEAARIQTLKLD